MAASKEILVVDAGLHPLHILSSRLRRLDLRVVVAKTGEEAHQVLVDPRRDVGAVVIPTDLPAADLGGAVRALRRLANRERLPFVAAGPKPGPEDRAKLRSAGVALGVFDPIDAHTLRYQLNRALADPRWIRTRRRALRAPAAWPVQLHLGRRDSEARVYTVSTAGCYLATDRPALRSRELELHLPIVSVDLRSRGLVVMTNVPGNLRKQNLPIGMGIRFLGNAPEAEAALQMYVEETQRALEL